MARPLVVAGVPEHFNCPWHIAIEEGIFARHSVDVSFVEVPEGTGKMCAGLADGSYDVAVLLTEGIMNAIVQGAAARVIATFVESPLTWAVLGNPKASNINTIDDLKGGNIGISRFGSGSHLMSFVMAEDRAWNVAAGDLKFHVNHNIGGLTAAVQNGETDAFLWEYFMTAPAVASGELKRLGTVVTPWPCFVIAASRACIDTRWDELVRLVAAVTEAAALFKSRGAESEKLIRARFPKLSPENVHEWFEGVRYHPTGAISRRVLVNTMDVLISAAIVPEYEPRFHFGRFYDSRVPLASVVSEEIRTVKLHYHARCLHLLESLGKRNEGSLTVDELQAVDQLHYFGSSLTDEVGAKLGLGAGDRVLDVGSGLGGPARWLAARRGCQVEALEIEEKRHELAGLLTERCGLSRLVHLHLGDASTSLPDAAIAGSCTAFFSLLVILHIKDRVALFGNVARYLKPGARFLIEDFVQLHPFSPQEVSDLEIAVACPYLPTAAEYIKHLEQAGFVDVVLEDISDSWRKYAADRVVKFERNRENHDAQHSTDLGFFFGIIASLFAGGNLGGCRITGRYQPSA